jgi:hypothetical protein
MGAGRAAGHEQGRGGELRETVCEGCRKLRCKGMAVIGLVVAVVQVEVSNNYFSG